MDPNMNDELWRVQLGTGEIRLMTLDGLDRAFDEGVIDAHAPVLAPGASAWTTLGQAAGLDDCPTEQTPSLSPVAISAPSSAAEPRLAEVAPLETPSLDELELRPRRRRGLVVAGIVSALAVAATLAVVAGKVGGAALEDVKATTAVEAPPAAVEALPAPEPATTGKPELSEWQKKLLLDNDKAREAKARAKHKERAEKAGRAHKRRSKKSNAGLLNGGDKFDPLNGQL